MCVPCFTHACSTSVDIRDTLLLQNASILYSLANLGGTGVMRQRDTHRHRCSQKALSSHLHLHLHLHLSVVGIGVQWMPLKKTHLASPRPEQQCDRRHPLSPPSPRRPSTGEASVAVAGASASAAAPETWTGHRRCCQAQHDRPRCTARPRTGHESEEGLRSGGAGKRGREGGWARGSCGVEEAWL